MTTIKLVFTKEREVFIMEISNKIITYRDRKLKETIQFMPKDPDIKRKVVCSRNRIPAYVLELIEDANSGHNLKEYQAAQTDEELVPIIVRDAKVKGCILQKKETIENG